MTGDQQESLGPSPIRRARHNANEGLIVVPFEDWKLIRSVVETAVKREAFYAEKDGSMTGHEMKQADEIDEDFDAAVRAYMREDADHA